MKYLNAIVVVIFALAVSRMLRVPTPAPKDSWFQHSVAQVERPVLVKFGADWCPPCRHMEGVLDKAEGRFSGRVKIVRIDIDEKPELAQHYGVGSIPHLILFNEGEIVASHGGFADVSQLQRWVDSYTR